VLTFVRAISSIKNGSEKLRSGDGWNGNGADEKIGEQQACVGGDVGLTKESGKSSKVGEVAYIEQFLHVRF